MKILHLCPLWYPISANAPGGIETLVSGLVMALEKVGCSSTLLASGDSRTAGQLVPIVPKNLVSQMAEGTASEYSYYEQLQLMVALELASEHDVLHSHVGPGAFVLSSVENLRGRVLHTQHNPVTPDFGWLVKQYPDLWLSTISEFQAAQLRSHGATRCHVVHNGVDVDAFAFQPQGDDGLLFIGRMEWEKGPDLAVQVARKLDCSLILAGPIIDDTFFDQTIRPFLNERIQYVGVVDHQAKVELYGHAGCVLMPSRWDEGFGMVAVEAMACGTPVVALARGALPEIIETDQTGYVTPDEGELGRLAIQAMRLDRSTIYSRVAARFGLSRMAEQHRELYSRIIAESREGSRPAMARMP